MNKQKFATMIPYNPDQYGAQLSIGGDGNLEWRDGTYVIPIRANGSQVECPYEAVTIFDLFAKATHIVFSREVSMGGGIFVFYHTDRCELRLPEGKLIFRFADTSIEGIVVDAANNQIYLEQPFPS